MDRKKGLRFQHLPQIALEYRVRPNSLLARVNTRSHYRKLNQLVMTKHFDLYSSLVPKVVREVLPNQFGRTDDGAKRNISTWVLWITTVFLGIRYSILRLTRK